MTLLVMFFLIIAIELTLYGLVHYLRRDFQWLITRADEKPKLDQSGLDKFYAKSFDPDLGWTRRPNTEGVEKGEYGDVVYHIDKYGSRLNGHTGERSPTIACFGDSYAFCRQVQDSETWEHYLGEILETGILNFGVGNYGLDQALLRYRLTEIPDSVNTVVMAFVPETICRIQSTWKHYLEFGNTFAFKPRYELSKEGSLDLIPSPIKSRADFNDYDQKLDWISSHDRFYKGKFRKFQLRFPYIISFLKNFKRNYSLIGRLIRRVYHRWGGNINSQIEDAPFEYIMNENVRAAHQLYQDKQSVNLFTALINEFVGLAKSRNQIPYVLILPQLIDLRVLAQNSAKAYPDVLSTLDVPDDIILDFTSCFAEYGDIERLYVNDKYGGHISVRGNQFVAKQLSQVIGSY
jgi:hypothetical protein